ncbi:hypothetical protein TNCV_3203961 [Trichonephila clavipes]|nr:hypothetical protein TNCV_3203961 [Trichonephila clavipes]
MVLLDYGVEVRPSTTRKKLLDVSRKATSPRKSNFHFRKRCSSPVTKRGCNFSPFMNSTPSIANAVSVVAQSKKDRVPGLGKRPDSINILRSPNSLKIIQFNINGISTSATRITLDQVLESKH